MAFKNYKVNPYTSDPNFPNPQNPFKVVDPGIYSENSTEKINITKKIKHSFSIPFRPNMSDPCYNQSLLNGTTNSSSLNCSNSSTNGTGARRRILVKTEIQIKCVSLQKSGGWDASTCEKAEQKEPDGTTSVKCVCKELSATSVTEDLVNIFENNPNVQNIIDINKGFDLISKMEWWLYIIFYFGAFFTLLWLRLLVYGYYKDIECNKLYEIEEAR